MTTNEYIRKKWGDRPQIDLAKEIAKRRGCGEDYNKYKGYVNKWFKTEQEPGKDYLLLLSEILNVSVESILRGADIVNDYGERPTAFSAAKSGDGYIIDRLFGNTEAEVLLHTKDEYGKSFVEYVVEFENYRAFQIAINKGYNYPTKWEEYLELYPERSQVDFDLTKMIVEADDLEMFKKAFGRLYRDVESPHAVFAKNEIPIEITALIFKSQKILEWLIRFQPFKEEEWMEINMSDQKVTLLDPSDNYVWKIPSMVYGYSYLLNCAIAEKSDSQKLLLDRALEYVKQIKQLLGNRISEFGIIRYKINSSEFALCFKNNRRYVWAIVPYIENVSDISNDESRSKAEEINNSFPFLDC